MKLKEKIRKQEEMAKKYEKEVEERIKGMGKGDNIEFVAQVENSSKDQPG
jgi:hypothetical protein